MLDSSTVLKHEKGSQSATPPSVTHFVDRLNDLVPCVRFAVENQTSVVALQLWERRPNLILLPFNFHLKWLNRVPGLSLNAKFGFAPFLATDEAVINDPSSSYSVESAVSAREKARRRRAELQMNQSGDFQIPDWEQGFAKHSDELAGVRLPGSSFLGIDLIAASSEIIRGNRSVLGRVSVRNASRPNLIVPSRSGVSDFSAQPFANVDLLVLNLQGLRGRRGLDSVRKILTVRGPRRPTLLVASSPSDLIALGFDSGFTSIPIMCVGKDLRVDKVEVTSVGENRHLEDRSFDFAVDGLRGRSDALDYLLDLAKSAWWASHQSLGDSEVAPEISRFENSLEKMSSEISGDAGLLTMGRNIIRQVAQNRERATTRRRAVAEAAITASGESGIVIIARQSGVRTIREEISTLLELPVDSLSHLGVRVQSVFSYFDPSAAQATVGIAAGYFGLVTIDKILMSGAKNVRLILDPTEARAAWYGIRKLIAYLRDIKVTEGIVALEKLLTAIGDTIPAHLRSSTLDISLSPEWFDFSTIGIPTDLISQIGPTEGTDVVILFTDGTRIDVSSNARFDRLGELGARLKTVTAEQLNAGDEIVLLDENARDLFSERLIKALDRGPLKENSRSQCVRNVSRT